MNRVIENKESKRIDGSKLNQTKANLNIKKQPIIENNISMIGVEHFTKKKLNENSSNNIKK